MAHYPKHLTDFLVTKDVLALGTYSGEEQPWVANLYYVVDQDYQLYFVTKKKTTHAKNVHLHPKISFSVSWYAPDHFKDRRTIQGIGECRIVTDPEIIKQVVRLHNHKFPDLADYVTDALTMPKCELGVYHITPSWLKYGDGHYLDGQGPGEAWIA